MTNFFKFAHRPKLCNYFSAKNILSGENIKKAIAKFSNLKPIRFQSQQPSRRAAVLIPICEVGDKVSLLYTLKASSQQKGQISFPGGLQEINDVNLEDTALREIRESLHIDPKYIEIWTCGNSIVTKGNVSIMPILGRIKNFKLHDVHINSKKLEEIFTIPLEDLCNPSSLKYTQFRNKYSVPVFMKNTKRIWGLTAIMTNMCLTSILPQNAYQHLVKYIPPVNGSKCKMLN